MATVPTPTTQTAGLAVSAATINSQGNLATYLAGRTESGGARRPVAALRQSVAQSLTTGTPVAVAFDIEDVDYDNGHSTITSTSRYTVGTAGWYVVGFTAAFAANAVGQRLAWIKRTGSFLAGGVQVTASGAFETLISGSLLAFANVGDYFELFVEQTSGGALNTAVTVPQASIITVQWVSV